jgi:putative NADH-flavin reductase
MRLAVLAATSRTGLLLIDQAIARGHSIVAFTRRPQELPITTPPITTPPITAVRDGFATDTMRSALTNVDTVISLLPGGDRREPNLAIDATRTLLTAMTDVGVKRLVMVSAYPMVADRPRLPVWILRRLLAVPYADNARAEQLIRGSDLDWTIVRLNRLTDKPATGAITTTTGLFARPRPHSRADAATVLLDLAADPDAVRTAINVSGT